MWLTSSSIGRKFVMALTGAFLILFVTFHVLMNGVALFWPSAYNVVCEFLGANWYAFVGTLILAAGFVLHILYALWLTWENHNARGNDRYNVTSRPPQVEWASKNMLVLGVVILCFLAVHMWQFWAKMQLVEILGLPTDVPPAAGTLFIQQAFSCPWTVIIYCIGFIALWFHMTHGFWSMCQSSGINNKTWLPRLKVIGNVWATVVCGLFVAEAIVFTVCAKHECYLLCPDLQEQYIEMSEDGKAYPFEMMEGKWSVSCGEAACTEADCDKAACGETACGNEACETAGCTEGACNQADCANEACAQAGCPEGCCENGVCVNADCQNPACPGKAQPEKTNSENK